MPPASRRRATMGASAGAICSAMALTPQVVAEPFTSTFSLIVNGTPASGPRRSPAASDLSMAAAAARAESPSVAVTALTAGLTSRMRARHASTTSLDVTRRSRIIPASSAAPLLQSSLMLMVISLKERG
jgi:hypothetical protein